MIPEASIQQAFGAPPLANDGQLSDGPATIAKFGEQQFVTVGTTPEVFDVTQCSNTPSTPKWLDQGVAFEIEARDVDVYVRFRSDSNGANVTPQNGRLIKHTKSEPTVFWLPGPTYQFMEVVSAGPSPTGVAFRRCSMARVRG